MPRTRRIKTLQGITNVHFSVSAPIDGSSESKLGTDLASPNIYLARGMTLHTKYPGLLVRVSDGP